MKSLKWVNTIAFAVMVAVNAMAELIPIGGLSTKAISALYPSLFTPAPITFSIWGVIYLLLVFFILFQWELFDGGVYSEELRDRIGPWFAVSCAMNVAWIFFWHFRLIALSLVVMVGLMLTLLLIVNRITENRPVLFRQTIALSGFHLYLGWIIAAMIANMSIFPPLLGGRLGRSAEPILTILMLLAGTVIGSLIISLRHDPLAGIALIWAYVGICIRHASMSGFGLRYPWIFTIAMFCAFLMATLTVWEVIRSMHTSSDEKKIIHLKQHLG